MATQSDNDTTGATRRSPLQLNEIRRADGGEREAPDRSIPEHLRPHYHQDGNAFRSAHRNDKIEFVDRGNRMHAYRPASTFTVRALAQIAEQRGFSAVEVTGDNQFKSRAYVELASRNIDVKGYEATDKDREILQRREDRKEAKDNPKVQAFTAAQDKKSVTAAVKKYPELKEAFATRAAIDKMAEGIDNERGRMNWQGAMQDRLAIAIHRGDKLPEVKLREEATQAKAPAANQER